MTEARGLVHRSLAWLFILLAFCGWVLMLAGVASLQQVGVQGMLGAPLAAPAARQLCDGTRR